MRGWTEGFHNQLRETFYPGQIDAFQELEVELAWRPGVRCKECAKPWAGEDARTSPAKALARGCWFVSNKLTRCPPCHRAKADR